MKKYIFLLLTVAPLLFSSCSDDDDKLPKITPAERGTVTDNEGNVYDWVRIGDLLWTTSNAKNGPYILDNQYYDRFSWKTLFEDDYGYIDYDAVDEYEQSYLPEYGNLMNYAGAVASAPDGWRLPSDDDWQKLERHLGMTGTDRTGRRGNGQAFRLQEKGSGTELAMQLGGAFIFQPAFGWISLDLDFEQVYGYYWTSTLRPLSSTSDEESAYFRKFLGGQGGIWREACSTQQLMSVRWVKDAE